MGKKKQQKQPTKKSNQQEGGQKTTSHEVSIGGDEPMNDEQVQNVQEDIQTPEEKAQKFKEMQLEIFLGYTKDFQEDEKMIEKEFIIDDRIKEGEKREKEELKKYEKVFNKEQALMEELQQDGNKNNTQIIKQMREKMVKLIQDTIKAQKQTSQEEFNRDTQQKYFDQLQSDIKLSNNKKEILKNMCRSLLDRSYDIYYEHVKVVQEQQQERSVLAQQLQERMKEVTGELEKQKQYRGEQYEENKKLRKNINDMINKYKKKEEEYKGAMNQKNQVFQGIEANLKTLMDGSVNKTLKQFNEEKVKYEKVKDNVQDLTTKIQDIMSKFDTIKDDMTSNNQKFQQYQEDIESKKLQVQLLETEIQNIQLANNQKEKIEKEIQDEKKKLQQQISMLQSLKGALEQQFQVLSQGSNKENQGSN